MIREEKRKKKNETKMVEKKEDEKMKRNKKLKSEVFFEDQIHCKLLLWGGD